MNEAYRELARQLNLQAQRGRELQTLSPLDEMTLRNAANALLDSAGTMAQLTALQDAVKEYLGAVDAFGTVPPGFDLAAFRARAKAKLRALVDPSPQEKT